MSGLDMDHLRQWIGREQRNSETITPPLVERFEATLGASASRNDGAAPLAIHWCLAPPAVAPQELGSDGHPARGGFLPPVPLPRRMWAGGRLTFHHPLRVGAEVTRVSRIADIAHKTGRSGELVFVAVDHDIECEGRTAISERQDLVYRGVEDAPAKPAGPSQTNPAPEPAASHSESVEATTTLLFRYSAVTFNGHRIHYDEAYARNEEGYPGLVVHGPLQATLLMHMASRLNGARTLHEFSFRGVAPLFHGKAFSVNAGEGDAALDLWCADAAGKVTMRATATF